jgi:hypothetical protein
MYTSLHGHITELRLCSCSDFCILLSVVVVAAAAHRVQHAHTAR